jgi:uncharacterized metal-binding protein YceD (DUF177 family)
VTADHALHGPIEPPVQPEMRRLFALAKLGNGASFVVEATEAECRALAVRMGVVAIHTLTCRFELHREAGPVIAATGRLRARLRQTCVVSLDPFDSEIAEDFAVRFVPAGTESEEVDISSDDEIGYEGGVLDLGEAASEQLALSLDAFPRKPGAALENPLATEDYGAFAALSKLRPLN